MKSIANEPQRFHTFVANRIACIKHHSKSYQQHHVAGHGNIADVISTGLNAGDHYAEFWISGPEFLHLSQTEWEQCAVSSKEAEVPELKNEKLTLAVASC